MKKDDEQTGFSAKQLKYILVLFLFLPGFAFFTRTIDSLGYFRFPYGHFHFPTSSKIPFFRLGEREYGDINEFGFRSSSYPKDTNCSYLLLGDSQTFGSGIFWKDSFPEILNRETSCYWINTSIPGFTLDNEFSMYQKVQTHFQFSDVYLFVYGNDVYELGDTPDFLHFLNHKKWYFSVFSFYFPESTRLYLKKLYFDSIQKRMELELERVSSLPYTPPLPNQEKNQIVDYLSLKTLFQISPTYLSSSLDTKTFAKKDFDRWKRTFDQLYQEIRNQGKKITIVYIPLEVEYDRNRYEVYRTLGFEMNPQWLESDSEFILDLIQLTDENRIPLIDLRKYMRYKPDLLQRGDIHLNERATRLIADVLKKK
ncbi:SGNH/GDSL hydrolase family protein [Leptospira brenneri]|uniref:SGNH/GDSL hydrolase family protein n=1 Tax=Leptospira brenneri TaxID=2023182 RepID=A0A5F1Z7T2_9LEPT|nr:SGNH/GDSL hydrolase family protein [Leptospira brenneri]TGK95526.1 SGNH/GDSL hydrolase family protein [Leptospira brenneri]